jgi:hypothetical protein
VGEERRRERGRNNKRKTLLARGGEERENSLLGRHIIYQSPALIFFTIK